MAGRKITHRALEKECDDSRVVSSNKVTQPTPGSVSGLPGSRGSAWVLGSEWLNRIDNVLFPSETLENRGWNEPLTVSPPIRQKWARRKSGAIRHPFLGERQSRWRQAGHPLFQNELAGLLLCVGGNVPECKRADVSKLAFARGPNIPRPKGIETWVCTVQHCNKWPVIVRRKRRSYDTE